MKHEEESTQTSPSAASNATGKNAPPVKPPLHHIQKRRRVTRACDECRRKKIKCDGKQPCTHCTVYSYECTYDQPSNRRRNPAPQYVENLEYRVKRAETLLYILIPNLDLNDPGIDAAVKQGWIPGAPGRGNPSAVPDTARPRMNAEPPPPPPPAAAQRPQHAQNLSDTQLELMVRAVAQLDMDEQGHWDYHGHSSGLSFVRRMREQLGDLMGPDTPTTPFVKNRPMSQVLDSPKSFADSPNMESSPGSTVDLPPIEYARQICSNAVDDATSLLRIVHKPSFWQSFERLYSTPPDQYTNEDNKFLPLFHSVMAVGHLFGKDDSSSLNQHGYESAIQQGFTHFKTARHLMDIADCRDLTSIQAVIFMIMFMQSSAKLSQCYAYIGVALRSALRLGLHRAHTGTFNPIESELRKRVFWIIRKMDIYVGAILGLPQTLSDDEIDQEFPLEVDDEYITKDGIRPMPDGSVSLMAAFNAHTRLVQLLQKIVQKIYPIKPQTVTPDKVYSVPFSVIREIENDLEQWKESLPPILTPCPAPERYTRVQQLLRLSYAHAQVMLYRPFLHFTASSKQAGPIDQRAYACAASYVNVSRNIIHITSHMKQKGLLNGSFWFMMYTSFFAILSLVYFAAENPDNPTTQAVIKDAIEGKQMLESLATRSMAADRCATTLRATFQRLPDWLREGQPNPNSKKRHFESVPQLGQHPLSVQASRSHPDISVAGRSTPTVGTRRASTFPISGPGVPISIPSSSYEPSWPSSGNSSYGPHTPTTDFDPGSIGSWGDGRASDPMGIMPHYPLPSNTSNPALPDISAMMFPPAEEPFGYPNQPLTTFENSKQLAAKTNAYIQSRPQEFGSVDNANAAGIPSSRGREDHMEAQFFALPPYMDQRQQQPQQHRVAPGFLPNAMNFGSGSATSTPTSSVTMPPGNWPSQQTSIPQEAAFSNINIQDIFGGSEWNPMIMGSGFPNS
ncbi:hypothetical protein M433DRAFT_77064 [Acidomyces richmondensis BFW]|nr:MAG: hypothetical protein FE78DRAFT_156220 [Acidomyces sp. 'richmondensis']KYG40881.1 hypothetical protein M433DRAFT_77064 [Acidomyces richmondensis BFW]